MAFDYAQKDTDDCFYFREYCSGRSKIWNSIAKATCRRKSKNLTFSTKRRTIRTSINYPSVSGTIEPAFACLADLRNPPHKWHGFRIFAHNPRRSLVRIQSPLLFPKRPEMVVFGLNMRCAPICDCDLTVSGSGK